MPIYVFYTEHIKVMYHLSDIHAILELVFDKHKTRLETVTSSLILDIFKKPKRGGY